MRGLISAVPDGRPKKYSKPFAWIALAAGAAADAGLLTGGIYGGM